MSFPYTNEGYKDAVVYLKSIGHDIKELSDDGYTIVYLANSIKKG